MTERPKILIVDDKVENLISLERVLSDLDVHFIRALSGNEALQHTLDHRFAIALVDVQMPDMDGFETVSILRQAKETRNLPVIFLSAIYKEDYYQIKGIQTGAVDFITKPIIPDILLGKVRIFLELYEKRRGLEQEIERRRASETALHQSRERLREINEQLSVKLDELALSEERFRTLVMTVPDIVYRVDKQGLFTFLNDAVRRIGYEPEELLGRHFSEILMPEDQTKISRQRVIPAYKGVATGDKDAPKLFDERRTGDRKTIGLELLLSVKGSSTPEAGFVMPISDDFVVVEINSSGIWQFDSNEQKNILIGSVGVIRDISERKAIEKALQESEERLSTIFEHAAAGLVVIDPQSRVIVDANPTALELIGGKREEVLGQECHRFICPKERENCPIIDHHQEMDNSERVLLRLDGTEIPILKTVASIQLEGRARLLESFVDIRKLKSMETELQKAHDDLEKKVELRTSELKRSQSKLIQTEKVAALGTLTAGIAHELNNPMMGMLNFVQYCQKHVQDNQKVSNVLSDLERETRRCVDIVRNLLTFSRMEAQNGEDRQPIACGEIVERVRRLLAYRLEKEEVDFQVHADSECPLVLVNVSNIQQVFLNLISNALDAVQAVQDKRIRVTLRDRGEQVEVVVADSGQGISPEMGQSIFDPFFTTKPVGKGTGLGLSVSRSIVQAQGGGLEYTPMDESGAAFTVRLPVN